MLFFAILIVVLVAGILLTMFRKKIISEKRSTIVGQLEDWIMEVVLDDVEVGKTFEIPAMIGKILKIQLAKRVLLRKLMELKKSLSGVSGENIQRVYQQLNLQEISLKRLNSRYWHIKARGLQELAVMHQDAFHEKVFKFTNDEVNMVRMEAQISMVRLQGYKGLQFFDILSYPLSEWHQLNLLSLLGHLPLSNEAGILNWLQSSNISVIQFSLKLIGEQHAVEFHDEVIKCLSHPHVIVRREAILCLGQMPSNEAAIALKAHFENEPDRNLRMILIQILTKTGSHLDLPFLQPLQNADDEDIKLVANRSVLYLQKN
ncbi:MAG: HEAT repeat domain-containing protein [Ferruginibacter sp.]